MAEPQSTPQKSFSEAPTQVHRPPNSHPGTSSSIPDPLEHDDDRPSSPPPYSGPISPTATAPSRVPAQPTYPGLPRLDYRLYSPSSFTLSLDQTTITSYDPRLSTYPKALVSLIQKLATIPPKPQVQIIGTSNSQVEFDVKINIMTLIVPEDERRRMNFVKLIGPSDMGYRRDYKQKRTPDLNGLDAWARAYCEDPNSIKQFVLERAVTNWDTSYIEGRLLSLVNSTSYQGHVSITFPITHSRVVVHSPDKVNRFFSNVTKVFTGTKKYEVVKSVWPYADVARGESNRKCVAQEEEVWLDDWKDAIRHAVIGRRKGWVTVEDRLEFLMEPKDLEKNTSGEWSSSVGGRA